MSNFFVVKAKLAKFYKDFEVWFQIIFKFLVAFFVFGYVNEHLGYYKVLDNLGIQTVLSLISAIVPSSIFVLLVAIVSIIHLYKLSLIMMVLALVVFIVFYFLYLKFAPKHGVLMLVIPVLMPLNMHFIVPLIAGLFFSPFTIVPVGCCFIVMKFVELIIEAAPMVDMVKLDVTAIVEAYQYVIDHVLDNKEMLLYAGVFAVVIVVTYVVSRLPFDYSWYVGIGLGTVASIVGMVMGGGMLGVDVSMGGVIFGSVISGLIMAVIQFLHCSVDYSRKEYVQFEDDDYFYYVKAIPKIVVSEPDKSVRTIYEDNSIILDDAQADAELPVEEDEEMDSDKVFGGKIKGGLDNLFGSMDEPARRKDKPKKEKKTSNKREPQPAKPKEEKPARDYDFTEEDELFAKYASDDTIINGPVIPDIQPEPETTIIPEIKLPDLDGDRSPAAGSKKTASGNRRSSGTNASGRASQRRTAKTEPKEHRISERFDDYDAVDSYDEDFGYDDSMQDYSDDSGYDDFD